MRNFAPYLLLLFFPTNVFACMVGPSPRDTLVYGVIKLSLVLVILFFSAWPYVRSTKTLGKLLCLVATILVFGSGHSIIFRYGLMHGPSCNTEFGSLSGALFFFSLLIGLIATVAFIAKKTLLRK